MWTMSFLKLSHKTYKIIYNQDYRVHSFCHYVDFLVWSDAGAVLSFIRTGVLVPARHFFRAVTLSGPIRTGALVPARHFFRAVALSGPVRTGALVPARHFFRAVALSGPVRTWALVPARLFVRAMALSGSVRLLVRTVALSGTVWVAIGPPPSRPQFGFGLCWQVFLCWNFLNWVPLFPLSFRGAKYKNFYLSNCLRNLQKNWKIHLRPGKKNVDGLILN